MATGTRADWRALARSALVHGFSAAFVAVFCYLTVRVIPGLHEIYWAPIAAVVVLYPDRESTRRAAFARFFGTIIGSLIGWASAVLWDGHALIYGAAVLLGVGICYLARLENASRLCPVAITVITIIPREEPARIAAFFRCVEVSYGVACALLYSVMLDGMRRRWPWIPG